MYNYPNYHPLLVHFPIALLTVAAGLKLLHLIFRKDSFGQAFFWTLLFGVLGAGAAVLSGEQAEDSIVLTETIHDIMEQHEKFGIAILSTFAVLFLWTLIRRARWSKGEQWFHLLLMAGGIYLIVLQADLGGAMVYGQGAGVAPMKEILKKEPQHTEDEERDEAKEKKDEHGGQVDKPGSKDKE